jgi:hypothetical protein
LEIDDMRLNLPAVGVCLLPVLLMCPGLPAEATNEKTLPELPAEIRTIIEGNQATVDSIHTMHGRITSVKTSSYVNKGTRTIQKTDEIWYDGAHVRRDVVDSKFIGDDQTPLLLREEPGGIKTTLGPLPVGHTEIESVESRLLYVVSNESVAILAPNWDERNVRRDWTFLNCQFLQGNALKTTVLACAKRNEFFTVRREALGGENCFLLECEFPKPQIVQRVWVVPSKGYCIKKQQLLQRGAMFEEYTATLKEYAPGLWWFESCKAIARGGPSEGDAPSTTEDVSVDSLTLNEPIDAKTFTLAGTDIPPGTRVWDRIANLNYIYATGYKVAQQDVDLALDAVAQADGKGPPARASVPGTSADSNKAGRVDKPGSDTGVLGTSRQPGTPLRRVVPIVLGIGALALILLVWFRKGRKPCG